MNFSAIPNDSCLGRALRLPLALIPPATAMPILQGRLRGKRWIVGAGNHGCWLGSYEYEVRLLFERTVSRGSVVFDVGAHAGFYALLASVLVGPEGRVYAFEPAPRNLAYLRRHLRLNRVRNVTVVEAAVLDVSGTVRFREGPDSSTGRVADDGALTVRAVSLDDLVEVGEVPAPDYIEMDIEGAEARALAGARRTLERARPTILLATHGDDVRDRCARILTDLGYRLRPAGDARTGASELLAVHPSRSPWSYSG